MSKQEKLLTYDEVLKEIEKNANLLLGNGFSMAYDYNRFSFTSLLKSAIEKKIIEEDSTIFKVFDYLKTNDFEYVLKILDDLHVLIPIYCDKNNILDVKKDSENLKEYLVDVITNNHPENANDLTDFEYKCCINFIKDYKRIFTLNYDLLIYWVSMRLKENKENIKTIFKPSDGFSYNDNDNELEFINDNRNLYFLHGALHIFDDGYRVIKNNYIKNNKTLKEQTLDNLKNKKYPIFVSEGTSKQKMSKINHNSILSSAYQSFKKSGSKNIDLVIFGTILKTKDEHIQEAILNNNYKNIYIGVSDLNKAKHKLNNFISDTEKKGKKIFFYDYKTVDVWGHNDKQN